jgi:predicted nucleotidyltransferase
MDRENVLAFRAARAFVRDVRRSGIRLTAAYVFGSYAKGTAHAKSDIDMALISPDFTGWVDDFDRIKHALAARDPRIEYLLYNPAQFRRAGPLAHEIKMTGIPLLGGRRKVKRRRTKGRTARSQ